MAASNTDKLRQLSRKWVGQIGSGGVSDAVVTTIPLAATTNLSSTTAVELVIDRVDSAGVKTPNKEETIVGVVSGSNIINCLRGVEGTAQAHDAGAVVEVLVTADGYNSIISHLLVGHNQDGSHGASAIVASNLAASSVTAGRISASAVTAGTIAASAVNEGNLAFSVVTASSTTTFTNKTVGDTLSMTTGNITSTACDIVLTPGTSKLVKIASLRQDNTTNTYKNNSVFHSGWGFCLGDGSTPATQVKNVTFGVVFAESPTIAVTTLGYKDTTDASSISDFSATSAYVVSGGAVTASGFTAQGYNLGGGSISASRRVGFSWVVLGVKN